MDVYFKANELAEWFEEKYFKNKDLVSINDLICLCEDLDADIERLKDELNRYENPEEYAEWGE